MDSAILTLGRPQACIGSFLSWQPLKGISCPLSSVQPLSSAHQVHAVQPSLCLQKPRALISQCPRRSRVRACSAHGDPSSDTNSMSCKCRAYPLHRRVRPREAASRKRCCSSRWYLGARAQLHDDTAHLQVFQQASADVLCLSKRRTWPLYSARAREHVLALTSWIAGAIAARLQFPS